MMIQFDLHVFCGVLLTEIGSLCSGRTIILYVLQHLNLR